ncbi:MAG: rhomboid family intramembrane serine protease [Elusimicrobia bacterium]|nr:rhomboid family intramembrane serine protease [Elusimicrobiota bacterium]
MSPRSFAHEPLNLRYLPPGCRFLIIACGVVFALNYLVGAKFNELFGLVPVRVVEDRWLWQPFSYLFLHGGLMHLLFNLFGIWMFGAPVESEWGQKEFLKYVFLCALGGAAAQIALNPASHFPVIGASAAVFGLLVAFAMLYPDAVVYLYFLIPVKASHMAILYGLIELFAGISETNSAVARFAHLGGMVTGYLYIRWWWVLKIRAKGLWAGVRIERSRPVRRIPLRPKESRPEMAEIDRILDKILVSGIESLTEEERQIMKRYSDKSLSE